MVTLTSTVVQGGAVSDERRWQQTLIAFVLAVCVMGLVRIDSVPLDSHEIFVAGTVRAMSERDDWVLPWFNGAPRLNKPPLSYWAAGGVAALAGDLPDVRPWHVRAVSVAAGIGILLCTIALGLTLFDARTALLAGALLGSSAGIFSFIHDARPDLLYAFFTTLMLLGLARAVLRPTTARWWMGLAWLACGLAILTKGPQLPLMVLVGALPACRRYAGSWRACLRVLQPLPGAALVAFLCVPWWWALSLRLSTVQVETSQLGGQLLVPSLSHLAELYYTYRPLQLTLPWIFPAGLALIAYARAKSLRSDVLLLAGPVLTAAVLLSFGQQYRYFYLLPLIGPLVLLLVRPLMVFEDRAVARARGIWLCQVLVVLACLAWVLTQIAAAPRTVAACLVAGIAGGLWSYWLWRDDICLRRWLPLAFLMMGGWAGAAASGAVWNAERYADQALADEAAHLFPPGQPVFALGVSPTVFAWNMRRDIPGIPDLATLARYIRAPSTVGVITTPDLVPSLERDYGVEVIETQTKSSAYRLLRVQPREPP